MGNFFSARILGVDGEIWVTNWQKTRARSTVQRKKIDFFFILRLLAQIFHSVIRWPLPSNWAQPAVLCALNPRQMRSFCWAFLPWKTWQRLRLIFWQSTSSYNANQTPILIGLDGPTLQDWKMPPFLANVALNDLKAVILKCTKAPLRQTSKCYMKKYTDNFVITKADFIKCVEGFTKDPSLIFGSSTQHVTLVTATLTPGRV